MSLVIDKSVTTCWSPSSSPMYLATGKLAGTLSEGFDTTGELEIYSPTSSTAIAKISTDEKFYRLSWSLNSKFIAGGMDNGLLSVWRFDDLIANQTETAFTTGIHEGGVKGLDFNVMQPNLLVSGGGKGKIYVWDLENDAKKYNISDKNPAGEAAITCTRWNRLTAPVLASSSDNGTVALWDLRKNKSIHHFKEADTLYNSIAWSPTSQTILATASETDGNAVIKIWDLKIAKKPIAVLEGHQEGVLSLSWSTLEPNLLLSAGMDEVVLCWDVDAAQAIGEVATTDSWISSVEWSPKPGMFSVSSNMTQLVTVQDFENPVVKGGKMVPPSWLVPRAGVSFGFGGKIAQFSADTTVNIFKYSEGAELADRAEQLTNTLSENDDVGQYCLTKLENTEDNSTKNLWKYLNIIGSSMDCRSEVIRELGFDAEEIRNNANAFKQKFEADSTEMDNTEVGEASNLFGEDDASEFPETVQAVARQENPTYPERTSPISFDSSDFDLEDLITKLLILGDFPAAVDLCFEANKPTEALILAAKGGSKLLYNTQKRYLRTVETNFSNTLETILDSNWESLVSRTDIAYWKELLAFCCTYADEPFQDLCNTIGDRLVTAGDNDNAVLCYICGGNLDGAINVWSKGDLDEIELIERVIIWSKIVNAPASERLVSLLESTGELLANNGHLEVSLKLLTITPEIERSQQELLSRLRNSLGLDQAAPQKTPTQQQNRMGAPRSQPGPRPPLVSSNPRGRTNPVPYTPPTITPPSARPPVVTATAPRNVRTAPPSGYSAPPSAFVPTYTAPAQNQIPDSAPPRGPRTQKKRKNRQYIPPTSTPQSYGTPPANMGMNAPMTAPPSILPKEEELAPPPMNATAPRARHQ